VSDYVDVRTLDWEHDAFRWCGPGVASDAQLMRREFGPEFRD
jgi:hypothetical protein